MTSRRVSWRDGKASELYGRAGLLGADKIPPSTADTIESDAETR